MRWQHCPPACFARCDRNWGQTVPGWWWQLQLFKKFPGWSAKSFRWRRRFWSCSRVSACSGCRGCRCYTNSASLPPCDKSVWEWWNCGRKVPSIYVAGKPRMLLLHEPNRDSTPKPAWQGKSSSLMNIYRDSICLGAVGQPSHKPSCTSLTSNFCLPPKCPPRGGERCAPLSQRCAQGQLRHLWGMEAQNNPEAKQGFDVG